MTLIEAHKSAKLSRSEIFLNEFLECDSPESTIETVAKYIQKALIKSDGIKIFKIDYDGYSNIYSEYLYHSLSGKGGKRKLFTSNKGLIERCLSLDEGFVGRNIDNQDQYSCISENSNIFNEYSWLEENRVFSLDSNENKKNRDQEKYILVYPFKTKKCIFGGVIFWRNIDSDYTKPYHLSSFDTLKRYAPYFLMAVDNIIESQMLENKKECIMKFFSEFKPENKIRYALNALLQQIGDLLGARHLLLLENTQENTNTFYSIAQWSCCDDSGNIINEHKEFEKLFKHFYSSDNVDEIKQLIKNNAKIMNLYVRDKCLEVNKDNTTTNNRQWLVIIFDQSTHKISKKLHKLLPDRFPYIEHILVIAYRLYVQFVRAHIQYKMSELKQLTYDSVNKLLDITADFLYKNISCESVIIYRHDYKTRVSHCLPKTKGMEGIEIGKGSLTEKVIKGGKEQFVFSMQADYPNKPHYNQNMLQKMADELSIDAIYSWLAIPISIKNNDQAVSQGLIKLITSNNQSYISTAEQQLAYTVVHDVSQYFYAKLQQEMLITLNKLCQELSPIEGDNLEKELYEQLNNVWIEPYIRPGCSMAIIVSTTKEEDLVFVDTTDFGLNSNDWKDYSKSINGNACMINKNTIYKKIKDNHKKSKNYGIATPIKVVGSEDVFGHLFVFSDQAFTHQQLQYLEEGMKELLSLFYHAKSRLDWRAKMGVFRHAVISAVQGVKSNARLIVKEAKKDPINFNKIRKCEARIIMEEQNILNWASIQRLLTNNNQIHARITYRDLKQLLESWVSRYFDVAEDKHITLNVNIPSKQLYCRFDQDLLDIAVSNLLENAMKYSPNHKYVNLKAVIVDSYVIIEVTNQGIEIPEIIRQDIFRPGVRGKNFASIPGQGIGLYLAKVMIEAHLNGELTYSSSENTYSSDANDKALICFTIKFAHNCNKQELRKNSG